jgi:hypothetical protein
LKSTPSKPRRRKKAPVEAGDVTVAAAPVAAAPVAAAPVAAEPVAPNGSPAWTITETAEASLARALELPAGEAAKAARDFVGELRPTPTRAQQAGCEIWRASPRWHRLRAVVEPTSPTTLVLRDVLPHADWQPPSARPAARPAKAPAAPARPPIVLLPPPIPVAPPPKVPEPAVLVVRRSSALPAQASAAKSPAAPAAVSVASALSTAQLLALHAALADWRRGGLWPGLTKLSAATELPRTQTVALAAEIEALDLRQSGPATPARKEAPLLVEVRTRVQRSVEQALRPLPATTWRELRIEVDRLAERIFVVTVSAGFETMDAVIEGLVAAKAEGIIRTGRSVRSVIRA